MQQVLMKVARGLSVLGSVVLLAAVPAGAQDVPYVPTPQAVVDRMLAMAGVTAQDYLIDLGSGDGRIVVTAAKKFGTRGFGVDLNPTRIDEANDNARRNGVADKVAFYQRNLFDTDLAPATVITMYLLPRVNLELRPRLLELKPGTRLVSHDFDMGDWKADQSVVMESSDKYFGSGGDSHIYFWIVPARVAGAWRAELIVAGRPQQYDITLEQNFQQLRATVRVNGRAATVHAATLRGADLALAFTADINGVPVKHELAGRVDGGRMAGEAGLSGARVAARVEWTAERGGVR